jgi:sigma-B regulation protein RsbU (phosphoserine phosphatase)
LGKVVGPFDGPHALQSARATLPAGDRRHSIFQDSAFTLLRRRKALVKQIPSYLKLVTDTTSDTRPVSEDSAAMLNVCRAFEGATGWRLEIAAGACPTAKNDLMWSAPVNPGVGNSPGHIRIFSSDVRPAGLPGPAPLELAVALAGSIGKLWGELVATRHALTLREGELAGGVPMVVRARDDDAPPLGAQLEAVLRAGAQAVGCDAAALYLLDSATTELKLRSSWGLPRRRLTEPARPLRGALADLEALLGHAVVVNDERLHDYWKVPEQGFAACVCVPLISQSMPLGTLWAYSNPWREFSDEQTNILEVVAGRITADLERETLVGEALAARDHARHFSAIENGGQDLPAASPLVEGWDIAARAVVSGPLASTFYDWFAADDAGALSVLVGETVETGLAGALAISATRAASRAVTTESARPAKMLERINSVLWTTSNGQRAARLFHAFLEPNGGSCLYGAAGAMRCLELKSDGYRVLDSSDAMLGSDESIDTTQVRHVMATGESLVVYGSNFAKGATAEQRASLDAELARALIARPRGSARELVQISAEILARRATNPKSDRVVMVIKRRGSR